MLACTTQAESEFLSDRNMNPQSPEDKFLHYAVPTGLLTTLSLAVGIHFDFIDKSFLQQFVTTLLGVGFGLPAAWWLEKRIELDRDRQDQIELLQAILGTIEKNLGLVKQLRETYEKQKIYLPWFPLDLTILHATSLRKYEVIKDVNTARLIDGVHYELLFIDEKLSLLKEMAPEFFQRLQKMENDHVDFETYKTTNHYDLFPQVTDSLGVHLPRAEKSLEKAVLGVKEAICRCQD